MEQAIEAEKSAFNFMDQVEAICSKGFALIRLTLRTKVPIKNENWMDSDHYDLTPKDFQGLNIGVKCGVKIPQGGYLCIVDIDVRNGGWQALKYLLEDLNIEMPPTMQVETGTGGGHFYLRSEYPLPKCKLLNGIDFQGVGSYCVGPGSVHENGKYYILKSNDEIAWIPKELEAYVRSQSTPFFDGKTGHFSETELVPEGGRDNYLTKVAGAMRRAGLSQAAIFKSLEQVNKEKCDPPLADKDLARIARSVVRYEPNETPLEELPTATKPEEKPRLAKCNTGITSKAIEKTFEQIYDSAEGLTKEIAHTIMGHTDRQYHQFAIASALAIIATVTQGGYEAPPLGGGRSGGGLSNYFWLIAPSAAGKDAYRHAVETYLRAIDDRLVFDRIGSNYGLRASLYCSNSGISIIDEFQDEMDRLGGAKASTYLNQVLTEMKELSGDLNALKAVNIAKSRYPAVRLPRYSIFGLGTIEGFMRHLTSNLIGGGLLSRFSVWPTLTVPPRVFHGRMETPPADQVLRLHDLYKTGLTEDGVMQSAHDEIRRFHRFDEKGIKESDIEHKPQHNPKSIQMKIDGRAKMMLIDFYATQEKIYMELLAKNEAANDISPGSIADRAPRFAVKIASWHALGAGRAVIGHKDAEWAILVSKTLSDWLCKEVRGKAGDDSFDRLTRRLLSILEASEEPLCKRQLYKATGNNYKSNQLHESLEALVLSGQVQALEAKTNRPLEVDGNLPKRGITFMKA